MEIQITVRNVYGNNLIYPYNDAAKVLAQIAGTKTLSLAHLELARNIGHKIVEMHTTHFPQYA